MKIQSKVARFMQQGGAAPAPQDPAAGGAPAEGAPMEGGAPEGAQAGNPMEQILQVAAQAVQTGNCEAALAVCQTLMSQHREVWDLEKLLKRNQPLQEMVLNLEELDNHLTS